MERITRLVEFETHDYMDMKPCKEVREFNAKSVEIITQEAILLAKAINESYLSGTITFKKVMSQTESIQFISKRIVEVSEDLPTDGKSDLKFLKELISTLEELTRG